MKKPRHAIYWIILAGLTTLLALSACRPEALPEVSNLPAAAPAGAELEEAGKVVEPSNPEVESTRPAAAPADSPSDEELVALVPTPPPGAIVPTPASIDLEPAGVRGKDNAPITVIEFSDYQCPFCKQYVDETYPQIIQNYVEAGRVKYIFADYPLEQLHPQANIAAQAARCAGEQNSYWEMHDKLFAEQERWSGQSPPDAILVEMGRELGLDQEALQACLDSGRYQEAVRANLAEGQSLAVSGTPTFFINGYPIVGARPYELFELAFALTEAGRLSDAYAQVPTPTPMAPSDIPLTGAPELGSASAPVLMIEYSDYQCPFCSRYILETFPQIKADYIDTGKLHYVFKDFPLSFHAQAQIAAEAARCAGDQGDYWGMHDLLFQNQGAWTNASAADSFKQYAQRLGLELEEFSSCLESERQAEAVLRDLQEGLSVGVSGTPAFFVGDQFISGAQPYEVFAQAIEAALSKQ